MTGSTNGSDGDTGRPWQPAGRAPDHDTARGASNHRDRRSDRASLVGFGIAYFVLTVAWQQTTTAMGWHDYSIVESVIYAAVFTAVLLAVQAWWDARRRRDTTTGEHPPA